MPPFHNDDEPKHRTPDQGDDGELREVASEAVIEERDDLKRRLTQLSADFDNVRKRQSREIESARQRERESLLRSLVDVLDSFDRALAAVGAESNVWLEGFESIRQQMLDMLRKFGAGPFDATREKFDPMRHEAVATVAIPGKADGAIVEVIQTGYEFGDGAVLRAAKVVVVRGQR